MRRIAFSTGEQFSSVLAEDLGRAHIAQYAGASGDFNLVHIDEKFATVNAGRDSTIAHGMLTMGLTGTFVTSLVGHGNLCAFGGRFLAPVGPGDTLVCTGTVTKLEQNDAGQTVTLHLDTSVLGGATVFAGEAVAQLPSVGGPKA